MEDKIQELESLFKAAGRAHHKAHLETGLDNPDWASWYADYLLDGLNGVLNRPVTLEELNARLVALDARYRAESPEARWPRYYAEDFAASDD